ncbi:fluoride efflux transporter CrcB [Nitrincola tapanii]|uniref:Fluoride-specific ion channel FluC n=1 Tax=Nitrincola tapanii TaxID=1708751 RepID=A0A5A9W3Q1_9GAMM|nr:fluoride efflux transporter CrcB [Nitrincola tapanii]KAA0875400.1 fluoride efflux transporter CrcB [Nitrincola tapanii]
MLAMLCVALGGALGALARYGVSAWLTTPTNHFPWATFLINTLGSFLMGVLFVLILEKARLPAEFRPLLMTGLLGGFTTFSTFSLEAVSLLHEGYYLTALIYVLLSVILCLGALGLGLTLSRAWF